MSVVPSCLFPLFLWYQLLGAFSPAFAFLLCVVFPRSHMFLVNVSVNLSLMSSSYGFMWQHTNYSLFFYLFIATISSFPYFHSPSIPLTVVSKGVFCSFFPCRPHSPWVLIVQGAGYNNNANYGLLNIISCMKNFCAKDR